MRAQVRVFAALVAAPLLLVAAGANEAETAAPKRGDWGSGFLRPPQREGGAGDMFALPPRKGRDAGKVFLRPSRKRREAENMFLLPPQNGRDAGRTFLHPAQHE